MSTDADNAQDARSPGTEAPTPADSTKDEGTHTEAPGRPLDDPRDETPTDMGAERAAREPWYDVKTLARRFGCTEAILHMWFRAEGGPKHRVVRGDVGNKIVARESVVRAWAEKNGKRAIKRPPLAPGEPDPIDTTPAASPPPPPPDSAPAADAGPLFSRADDPPPPAGSLRDQLVRMQREISLLMKAKPDGTSASQTKAWADAVSQLSKEARQIEAHLVDQDEREGRVVERRVAARLFAELTREFTTAVETIAPDVVRSIYDAVREHHEVAQTPEGFTRVGIAACRGVVESLLSRISDAIQRTARAIDPAAPGPAPAPAPHSARGGEAAA